jgi:tetratricopeptide (TPR) repeat protein
MGDLDASEQRLNESLAISRRYLDDYTETLTLIALARLHLQQRDRRALVEAENALAISRKHRMDHHIAESLAVLGEIHLAQGSPTEAVRTLEESVAIWRSRGWLSYEAAALAALGRAYAGTDPTAARTAFTHARDIYLQLGQPNTRPF